MSTVSKTILIGNLGQDPQTTTFEGGGRITRFSVATTDKWTDKTTGEKKELTEWHNVTTRNKQSEICEKYLSKGDKVYIEGQNRTRKWTDKDGNDRYSTEVSAHKVTFLSTKGREQTGSAIDAHEQKQSAGDQFLARDNEPDDLPF